jgi:hypothetical protein
MNQIPQPNDPMEIINEIIGEAEVGASLGTTTLLSIELNWIHWTVDMFALVKKWLLVQVHHTYKVTCTSEMLNVSVRYEGSCLLVTSPLLPAIQRRIVFTAESLGLKMPSPTPCFTSGVIFHSPQLSRATWKELVMSVLGPLRRLEILRQSTRILELDCTLALEELRGTTCQVWSDLRHLVDCGYLAEAAVVKPNPFWMPSPNAIPNPEMIGGMDINENQSSSWTMLTNLMSDSEENSNIGPMPPHLLEKSKEDPPKYDQTNSSSRRSTRSKIFGRMRKQGKH